MRKGATFITMYIVVAFLILQVGHSIGAYIALEVFRRKPEQVKKGKLKFTHLLAYQIYFLTLIRHSYRMVLGCILHWAVSIFGVEYGL